MPSVAVSKMWCQVLCTSSGQNSNLHGKKKP